MRPRNKISRAKRAQNVTTNELFVVGVTLINGVGSACLHARVEVFLYTNHFLLSQDNGKRKKREDAIQKGKINLKASWGPLSRNKSGGPRGSIPCSPPQWDWSSGVIAATDFASSESLTKDV